MMKKGFTLVELLIVIALIIIITAIAVPNLISANIKAKVKGIKSEMGSIAIALEDYRVDEGNYPIEPDPSKYDPDEIAKPKKALSSKNTIGLGKLVFPTKGASDPVYLYRIPGDPFNDGGEEEWDGKKGAHNNHYCYFTGEWDADSKTRIDSSTKAEYWALVSYGPDKDQNIDSYTKAWNAADPNAPNHDTYKNLVYNPDNGITSSGDIVIIGP